MLFSRNASAHEFVFYGMKAVILENEYMEVGILPGKGGDIFKIIYKPADMEVMLTNAKGWGQFSGRNLKNEPLTRFSEIYAGGWQDLVPHVFISDVTDNLPPVGESSTVPWEYEVMENAEGGVSVKCTVSLPASGFYIEREFLLTKKAAGIRVRDIIQNMGKKLARFTWTHHTAFGGNLIDESTRIHLPECTYFNIKEYNPEKDLKLFEGTLNDVRTDNGLLYDVTRVMPRNMGDSCYFTMKDVKGNSVCLENMNKKAGTRFEWDSAVYPYIRYWMRNDEEAYTVAIEPSSSYCNDPLHSLKNNLYLTLQPGEHMDAWAQCLFYDL